MISGHQSHTGPSGNSGYLIIEFHCLTHFYNHYLISKVRVHGPRHLGENRLVEEIAFVLGAVKDHATVIIYQYEFVGSDYSNNR